MKIIKKTKITIKGLIGIIHNLIDIPNSENQIEFLSLGPTTKGKDIEYIKFGNGQEKILYIGGIHGNETGTVKLMKRWMYFLNNNPDKIPSSRSIYIIPCLNVDGYESAVKNPDYFGGGTIGKTNANKVDINRNFPTNNWQKNTKMLLVGDLINISGGEEAGSEYETRALINFIKNEKIKTVYVYHSCMGTVFGLLPKETQFKAEQYASLSGLKLLGLNDWNNLPNEIKSGQFPVWGSENNIDIIEIENKNRWGSDWIYNKSALINSMML